MKKNIYIYYYTGGTIRKYSKLKHCLLRQTQMQIPFMLSAVNQKSAHSLHANYIPCLFAQNGGIQSLLESRQDEELSSEVKVLMKWSATPNGRKV